MDFSSKPLFDTLQELLGGGAFAYSAAVAITLVLSTVIIWIVWRLADRWRKAIHRWIDADDRGISSVTFQDQQIFTERQIARALHKGVNYAWLAVRVLLFLLWLNLVFSQFDWSREVALAVFGFFGTLIAQIAQAIVAYLPNLGIIVVVVLLARLVLHMVYAFFEGIRLERISLPGFYPDWARTSYGLAKVLIIALTLVIIFPYLPGSSSPAFQGVSIFFGLLVSLGSTSVVANIMAGIVITYTRAFKIGDRVRIADTEGDIIERSAFVTRLRTPKNEEVAIPNAMVMANHIVNFSAQAKEEGVMLHTTVTIGYDVPWPRVHAILTEAAMKTAEILDDPPPFVLQTSLDDNYVAYELNAYTRKPGSKARISSDMHANIQDGFRDAEIEILSPMYQADRDGSNLTLPTKLDPGEVGIDPADASEAKRQLREQAVDGNDGNNGNNGNNGKS
ncbi:MAG: mechanosensitive ion channel family protein [Xanthomonadales bacterium]|jgi:small-conductance mechanosensitive channel|nr:mechanosensitive ion channel family protein [Xanthomonadales bacterium]